MKNKIVDIVPKLIRQVVGRGSHQLHEPSFQIENLSMCQTVKTKFVSSAGKYVVDFEKKFKDYVKVKTLLL